MGRVRVASVSYLNSIPFVYGLSTERDSIETLLRVPSLCAQELREGNVDVALIPVAAIPSIADARIITDYCISSSNFVRTVEIFSNVPLEALDTIYLDSHSLTSATLIKILAAEFWNISPKWAVLDETVAINTDSTTQGYLLIGDKVFDYEDSFSMRTDLCSEWRSYTGLPFVFAAWVAGTGLSKAQEDVISKALAFGVSDIETAISVSRYRDFSGAYEYLTSNIEFTLSEDKRKALRLFLRKAHSVSGAAPAY